MFPALLLSRLRRFLSGINPRRSFRFRLGLAVGSVAFALSILLSLLVGYSTTQQIEADTGHFFSELAYQMADKLDRGMFERYRDIQIAASLDTLRNPEASLEAKRALIEKLQSTYNDYAWIGLANLEGKVVVSTGKILEGANVSVRPWFINGQKAPYVGDVQEALLLAKLLPNPTNEPLRFVDVTSVVTDLQDNSIGVLGAHLSWTWAKKVQDSVLRSVEKRSQVEMLVLSKSGDVLLGPPNLQGKLKGETLRSFQRGIKLSGTSPSSENNSVIETWPDGNQYLIGFTRSTGYLNYPGLDWVVLVRQKTDIAFAPARSLQQQITIWGLLLGLLSASLSSLIASRVVSPILAIASAADKISFGNATVKIPVVRGDDEVAILSNSLSNLLATLNLQKQDLHRLNQDLEMRVEQRTSQLQAANVSLKQEILQRQHAQAKQAELLLQLENSNQDLSDFARVVSHDLKAPLRSIQTLASWIFSDYADRLDEDGQEQLSLLMEQVQRSRDLINGVLHYSQQGSNQGEKLEVNLNSLVTEVLEMLPSHNIDIEIVNELPTLACQPVQMQQIFQNLISNAVKYMDKPQGTITIGCIAEQNDWKFSVTDNGPGIDSKYFDHIFQLFRTLPSNNQVDSTGVGLATVKKIVELYGGKIWVESIVGDGSTFFFTLPKESYGCAYVN